ncbi:hypothetical protein Tco_0064202 [Tanacetum coccineum]
MIPCRYLYFCSHPRPHLESIPSEDPYEEAAQQLLEQAPRSPEYIPDPMELEDHVPVYIPEPEHPEDLVPAEDEAPTPLLPPFFLSPRIRPLGPRALRPDVRLERVQLLLAARLPGPLWPIDDDRHKMVPNMRSVPGERDLLTSKRVWRPVRPWLGLRLTAWALEARVTVLETEVHRHEWQRQAADDLAVQHIMRTQALEAGARVDTLEDTGSSS